MLDQTRSSITYVYEKRPAGFKPKVEVTGCYVMASGKLLLLQNAPHDTEPNTWGIPAGKLEATEHPIHAACRELLEETGISCSVSSLRSLEAVYFQKRGIDFVFHIFYLELDSMPSVTLSDEHQNYGWFSLVEAQELPLMPGAKEALQLCAKRLERKEILKREFYFVRHGQTDHNVANRDRFTDQPNNPLNDTGRKQAKAIESIISTLPIKTVCFSPLLRAEETKDLITARLQIAEHAIENLGECTTSVWYEMTEQSASTCVEAFFDRVRNGINRALSQPGPVLIVSHGGCHYATCSMLGVDTHWKIDNCTIVHFTLTADGQWKAQPLN